MRGERRELGLVFNLLLAISNPSSYFLNIVCLYIMDTKTDDLNLLACMRHNTLNPPHGLETKLLVWCTHYVSIVKGNIV